MSVIKDTLDLAKFILEQYRTYTNNRKKQVNNIIEEEDDLWLMVLRHQEGRISGDLVVSPDVGSEVFERCERLATRGKLHRSPHNIYRLNPLG